VANATPIKRWTCLEYDRLIETGVFGSGERLELLGGLRVSYARAGLADYWVVNLVDHVLEVHREPLADPAAPHGWRYASVVTLRAADTVTPLAAPGSAIPVADLVP